MGCSLNLVGFLARREGASAPDFDEERKVEGMISCSFDEDLCCFIVNKSQARLWYPHPLPER